MLPSNFLQSLQGITGFDEDAFVQTHAAAIPTISIRINPNKNQSTPDCITTIAERIPWCDNGYYLKERPVFTLDPLLHAGAYYVQEASSMFLEQALKQTIDLSQSIKVLDLCAAPGGKSTLLQSLISKESLLVSNEVIKTRVSILSENITKWGAANVIVTNNDAAYFTKLTGYFDVIVVDAPCSGSGLFRKDENAIAEWSENNVMLCSQRQQRILADVLPALKQGGILIYSTCSYSKQEDEDIVNWLANSCKLQNLPLKIDESLGIIESMEDKNYGYRFYPNKVKGEGFFIAAFKKVTEETEITSLSKIKNTIATATKNDVAVIKNWLIDEPLNFFTQDENTVAIAPQHFDELNLLKQLLYIKKAGIKLGAVIRTDFIPHHELALSNLLHKHIASIELDKEQALQYLRKQDVVLNTNNKGWTLMKYKQQNLGWAKLLPNRINNYYPKDWRILMQ